MKIILSLINNKQLFNYLEVVDAHFCLMYSTLGLDLH